MSPRKPTSSDVLTCRARGCCCGAPVVIRTINGRKVPIHI